MSENVVVIGVRGLGRRLALHFAREKWRVVCAARTRAEVESLAREVEAAGGRGVPVVCDLADAHSLSPLVTERVDLCIASQSPGGRFGARPLVEIDPIELHHGWTSYVQGTWNLLQVVGAKLLVQGRGTFVQIGTSSGVRAREGFAALGAAQSALRALVQVAAKEWRPAGIHVAYVPVDAGIAGEGPNSSERMVPREEIARACEYLHRQPPTAWTHELVLRPRLSDWTAPT